ncbi:MAG: hypothetical protein AB7V14_03135 [Kiritimatiellia bacterium]
MPTYQLVEILTRIGLALGAGVLVFIVPLALRKARFAPHAGKRVFLYVLALAALVGFCFYVYYLWTRYVPREPEAPAPIAYPVSPAEPAGL